MTQVFCQMLDGMLGVRPFIGGLPTTSLLRMQAKIQQKRSEDYLYKLGCRIKDVVRGICIELDYKGVSPWKYDLYCPHTDGPQDPGPEQFRLYNVPLILCAGCRAALREVLKREEVTFAWQERPLRDSSPKPS